MTGSGTQILRIRTKFTAFPVSPARKLSGCDPHFRPSYGVARCADLRGPRAAGGNSVWCSRICQFCAPGYSVGRARAEFAGRIRKSHRIWEQSATRPNMFPILMLRQACTQLRVRSKSTNFPGFALNASLLYVDSFQNKMRIIRVFVCSGSTIHRRMRLGPKLKMGEKNSGEVQFSEEFSPFPSRAEADIRKYGS